VRLTPSWPSRGSPQGISPVGYALAASALLLSQHGLVVLAAWWFGEPLVVDAGFWWLPVHAIAGWPAVSGLLAALAFTVELAICWRLARLSFRRAGTSRLGFALAALTIVPGVQMVAVPVLALLPNEVRDDPRDATGEFGTQTTHIVQGVLAGVAIIVGAVALSAATLGTYGWGLFVATPFLVGVTTANLANRDHLLSSGRTMKLVTIAAALGCVALITFALEGLVCLILAAPLGAVAAIAGGMIGRAAARARHHRGAPLASVALLPLVFALEAVMPPTVAIHAHRLIRIDAPPGAVWAALTSDAPVWSPPGAVEWAGLATPVSGRLLGCGVGAIRLGRFSTGVAVERVTDWQPNRRLAFAVLRQPPMMTEMSPYRRVHAPHVDGYFVTHGMSFALRPDGRGGTWLDADADHELRIDPALYWRPLAVWAIDRNLGRVLEDVRRKSTDRGGSVHGGEAVVNGCSDRSQS